jgi:hypothetical protein
MLLSLLGVAAGAGIVWLALTSLAPGSAIATWAPCPRNWAWVPAWGPRRSPLDAVAFEVAGGHGKLCYGRPALRGRTMIGGAAVPYGELWRTGANEPTTLHLDTAARIGALVLSPGSYSLYTVPGPERWQIVLNRSIRQWGLESEYTDTVRAQEITRFTLPVATLTSPVERLTFRAVPSATGAVDLVFAWQTTEFRLTLEPLGEASGDAPLAPPV